MKFIQVDKNIYSLKETNYLLKLSKETELVKNNIETYYTYELAENEKPLAEIIIETSDNIKYKILEINYSKNVLNPVIVKTFFNDTVEEVYNKNTIKFPIKIFLESAINNLHRIK